MTKLAVSHNFDNRWRGSASLRYYWGFPSGEDISRFFNGLMGSGPGAVPLNGVGFTEAFDANAYLNLGLQYKPTSNVTFRFDASNTLDWIDIKLNIRNFIPQVSDCRAEAPKKHN
jgi:hypothetical protein